jgi:hypothetical protein
LSIPFVQVDIGLLADQVGVAAPDTLDLGQGVHDLLLAIDVGVEETKNELEVRLLSADESCECSVSIHLDQIVKAVAACFDLDSAQSFIAEAQVCRMTRARGRDELKSTYT